VTSFPSPKASCPTRRIGLHCWLGHDQIRLKILFPVEYAEVGERKPVGRFGYREDVAGLVAPGLEMNRLGRADAEQDAQHFDAGVALRQCRIELLPPCSRAEMKCRGLSDRLDVVRRRQILLLTRWSHRARLQQARVCWLL
jgi:hypothetical protein